MTIQQFRATSQYVQKSMIKLHGTFLLKRKTAETYAYLFQVDGFYAEVFFNEHNGNILEIKAFDNTDELEPYLDEVDISEVVQQV
jgi:murein L,D-transpeptidase YafK